MSIRNRIARLEAAAVARPSYEGTPLADWTPRDCMRGLAMACGDAPWDEQGPMVNDRDASEEELRAFIRAYGNEDVLGLLDDLEAAAVADGLDSTVSD